ncbi:MAG TPA: amidohydrolase family protein [Planctomycetota bacterium]|nr:amidohydrolase family protein [Planctomycetota bacterium]
MNRGAPFILAVVSLAMGQEPRTPVTVIRAGRIHTVSGSVVDHGLIVIEGGRVVEVRPGGELPPGATVIDAEHETVIPGLIDAQASPLEPGRDSDETIAPDVRAIDGYDFYASNWKLLSAGVTATCISPGSRRLLSGQSAVVKTAGRDPSARTLVARLGLRIALGEGSKNPPALYEPPIPASADHPLRPAKKQYPTSRMGEFAVLRRAGLNHASLLVAAHNEDDLVKAILFAQEQEARLILVDAEESPGIVDLLAEKKIPVLYNAGFSPGRRDGADPTRHALEAIGTLEGAAVLARAGVRFALIAPEDPPARDPLFLAAAAVRSGLSEPAALAAVTLAPADILGVADRVGSIAKGRDADLVFLSGDPFAPGSAVTRVMVDGDFVFERKSSDVQTYRALRDSSGAARDLVAIRGGRLLTVTQGTVPEGLVFIENGKISYVGRGRPIPAGARVLDATGMTVVPGFVDLGSSLGLHVDRTDAGLRKPRGSGVPPTSTVAPSRVIDPADPVFRAAAAAGVTAILLSPETSGVCSVIKMSGAVARDVAAIKFTALAGTAGYQGLKDTLAAGRKYHDDWEAYERARRDGGGSRDPVSGSWKGTLENPEQAAKTDFVAELKLEGTKVTGTIQSPAVGGHPEAVDGSYDQSELKLEQPKPSRVDYVLKLVAPDHLKGTWTSGAQKGLAECRREAPASGTKTDVKEPKKDEALEPYRRLFAKEIPAIVVARSLPAIENAVKAFRSDHGLDLILAGADDAAFAGDMAFSSGVSMALGPDFMRDRRGARINAAEALASQGVPIAFASAGAAGTARLPLQAAYAVRNGLEPFDSLKALTVNAARMLRMDSRLGAIERGRDGDLVIFSGDPFAPSSAVRYVLIDGKVVVEALR